MEGLLIIALLLFGSFFLYFVWRVIDLLLFKTKKYELPVSFNINILGDREEKEREILSIYFSGEKNNKLILIKKPVAEMQVGYLWEYYDGSKNLQRAFGPNAIMDGNFISYKLNITEEDIVILWGENNIFELKHGKDYKKISVTSDYDNLELN